MRALYDQQVDIGFIQDDLSQVSYFRYRAASNDERYFIVQFNTRRASDSRARDARCRRPVLR